MLISLLSIVFLCLLSVRADVILRHYPNLPMQFTLNGRATWSLPRRVGLLVTPVLAISVLGFVLLMSHSARAHGTRAALNAIALAFPIAHMLHLYLAKRFLEKAGTS